MAAPGEARAAGPGRCRDRGHGGTRPNAFVSPQAGGCVWRRRSASCFSSPLARPWSPAIVSMPATWRGCGRCWSGPSAT